jgi:DNA ligase D-like protein (predicted 3'-phosphoesterase)
MARELGEYRRRRDPARTGEPTGTAGNRGTRSGGRRFVVQRHDASSRHFDFRLEVDDVLASWAVPKGPSPDPSEKRLATRTEDHPLDYADFEGRIPAGQYGAGTVVVWDTGSYRNLGDRDVAEQLRDGHLKVWLDGHKLTGGYLLQHTRMRGDDRNWLLMKLDDEAADRRADPARRRPESVLSGRTNEEL